MVKIDLKIFKVNDIRGKYPKEINERVVFEIANKLKGFFPGRTGKNSPSSRGFLLLRRPADSDGQALLREDATDGQAGRAGVIVGHDARLSSTSLYNSVLKAFKSSKRLKVFEAGLITTPQIYFLVNKLKADGGIMITASHNPKEYNGLKAIDKKAMPISRQDILKIMNR